MRTTTAGLDAAEAATLESLLGRLVEVRVAARIEAPPAGETGPWLCRTCDMTACGRPEDRCPAQVAGPAARPVPRLDPWASRSRRASSTRTSRAIGEEVARIGSADWVHVDVMDDHFVPNLTFGPTMVEAIARSTDVPLDAHLMIADPDRRAVEYIEAGCGSVTFHVEAATAPVRLAREIRKAGARASMALKPATAIEPYEELLPELDMLLIMTVEPGFGGQKFLDLCLPKIRTARQLMDKHGVETWLQVDGGISLETIERCAEAGADVFVAGSAVYSADDPDRMVAELRAKAETAAP